MYSILTSSRRPAPSARRTGIPSVVSRMLTRSMAISGIMRSSDESRRDSQSVSQSVRGIGVQLSTRQFAIPLPFQSRAYLVAKQVCIHTVCILISGCTRTRICTILISIYYIYLLTSRAIYTPQSTIYNLTSTHLSIEPSISPSLQPPSQRLASPSSSPSNPPPLPPRTAPQHISTAHHNPSIPRPPSHQHPQSSSSS